MATQAQPQLIAFRAIADELLSLSGSTLLRVEELKSYVVLERKTGKSPINKNAVSVLREGVVFMLTNWKFQEEAAGLGLEAMPDDAFPDRLKFPTLTLKDIQQNSDYFARLTREAMQAAECLQTPGAAH